jgi:hypothetical protein
MKFFRRIRQQSFANNHIGKYLLYAVGEIILVVIGILLAIQINDRYDAIKIRESQHVFLKNLKEELTANYEALVIAMSYQERSKNAAFKLREMYSGDFRAFKTDQLDSLLAEVQWTWTFDPKISVLNSIKFSSQINSIQNGKILSFITSYEESVRDSQEESIIIRSLIVDKYVPLVSRYVSEAERARYIGYKEIGRSKFKADYTGLFNDREAESLLAYIYVWRVSELDEVKEILKMMKECIEIVEKEIAK